MTDIELDQRGHVIADRVELYLHTAKRLALDVFGAAAEREHNELTIEIAQAMVALEAAHIQAEAIRGD